MHFYIDLQARNQSVPQVNIILKTKEVIYSDFQWRVQNQFKFFLMDFKNIWKE